MHNTATTAATDTSAMAQLLSREEGVAIPKPGDLVTGRILSVSKTEVHLDIEGLTTGIVRGRELYDESGETADLKAGDEATATVLELENENGEMELSFRTAGHRKAWDRLLKLRDESTVVDALITDANRGGLMVKVERIEGFLPVSQLTSEHYPRVDGGDKQRILELLSRFVGQTFKTKVIDVNEREEKLIVSEKAAREEAQRALLAKYHVGQVVRGRISGVVDFGAFMEFDAGLEGLIHISELAWQRIEHPRDFAKVGQELEAKIIGIEGTKVSLSVKQLTDDPWKASVDKYHVGQVVRGTVVRTNTFGAFVELDPEIQGLCHISELAHRLIRHPHDAVKEGEAYAFQILSIDPAEHRLGLSKKALEETEPEAGSKKLAAGGTPAAENRDPVSETGSQQADADSQQSATGNQLPAASNDPIEQSSDPEANGRKPETPQVNL